MHRDTVMQRIFPNRSKVVRLGHVAADITNRMPEKIDVTDKDEQNETYLTNIVWLGQFCAF